MYMAAEHARWESGAELEAADFEALLAHLGPASRISAARPSRAGKAGYRAGGLTDARVSDR